jgi:hypothetical protein
VTDIHVKHKTIKLVENNIEEIGSEEIGDLGLSA